MDFTGADLELATFTNCVLSSARLSGAKFRRTILRHCDLSGGDLRNVAFADCSLIDPDLRGADLRGANFGNSLQGGRFDAGTRYDKTTNFPLGFPGKAPH